jgi:ADP-ribose pyrophosphatase YjhB (NUDIX family)
MQTKVLIIAIIENQNGEILLRKKTDGSPPYKETWYMFGTELIPGQDIEHALVSHIQKQTGVTVRIKDQIGWDTEVKHDLDGIEKQFVYLDVICEYIDGDLQLSEGIEKLEWVAKDNLAKYDNVPPSVKLFKKLGYIQAD